MEHHPYGEICTYCRTLLTSTRLGGSVRCHLSSGHRRMSASGRLLPVGCKGSGRPLRTRFQPLRLEFLFPQVERRLLRNHQPFKPQEKHHHHWLKSARSGPTRCKKEPAVKRVLDARLIWLLILLFVGASSRVIRAPNRTARRRGVPARSRW